MKCKYCGCTDDKACPGGCYWVLPKVCIKCLPLHIKAGHKLKPCRYAKNCDCWKKLCPVINPKGYGGQHCHWYEPEKKK